MNTDAVIPDPATPIPEPAAVKTNEELYLAGLHLEQYRHATYSAEDYYAEAIKRDPSDIRNNNAMGLLYLRRGQYKKSEEYFRKAIEKLNKHNPNPYDGEPFYNLGLSLKCQEHYDEAYTAFFKSTWNAAMQDNAFLHLAYIESIKRNWNNALSLIEKSLVKNNQSLKARHLKAVILRQLRNYEVAAQWTQETLGIDHFDFGSRYELYRILSENGKAVEAEGILTELKKLMRDYSHNYIEIAIDYANAGGYTDAFDLLSLIANSEKTPLTFYYLGYYALMKGDRDDAKIWFDKGFQCSPHKVFPNRLEDIEVLTKAIETNNKDYKAHYYLGNFYYAKHRYEEAKICWEKSVAIFDMFPTTHRNLGIAYFNKFNKKENALKAFEKAFQYDTSDSRVLFELDQLYKRFHKTPQDRLSFLKNYESLVSERDDLYTEYVLLHALTRQYKKAKMLLGARNFHPWEGGEGKTSGLHVSVHIELAKQALHDNNLKKALTLLEVAQQYPENLGEGKLYGAQENDIHYWMGRVYEQLNKPALARQHWSKASIGLEEPAAAIFYNDQQPDKIFYQGLAMRKLGKEEQAYTRFNSLIQYGTDNLNKPIKIDYFAVSLPDLIIFDDDLNIRNNIHCHFLQGLGYLGLKEYDRAENCFIQVLELDPAHAGAVVHQSMLDLQKKETARMPFIT